MINMNVSLKRVICMLLVFILAFGTVSCGKNAPVETAPPTEIATIPSTEPPTEPPVDPFTVEDGIADSTNDIVIDFYEFLEERNAAHKAVLDTTYSDEFIKEHSPDFHDTMNLVSKEEAKKLLAPVEPFDPGKLIPAEAAIQDVDLLFRILKAYYGPYYYFGGDEAFDAAKARIIEQIEANSTAITMQDFANAISGNLDFILDRHFKVGEQLTCDYNNISVYDFCVKDLYFYQDDVGYYTRISDRKWYLAQVGDGTNILDYLQITVDEKGQLCYCILLCEPKNGAHQGISEITLSRGDRRVKLPIEWTMFEPRAYRLVGETITDKNNIPLLNVGFWVPGVGTDASKSNEQLVRLQRMGKAFLAQDVFIYDFVSGSGCQTLFDSINHAYVDLSMYRLSQLASDLGRWNMPWHGQSTGPHSVRLTPHEGKGAYAVRFTKGIWGKNDTLAFTVQDKTNYSASEGSIADIRAIENCLTIGGSTGGVAGPSGATNQTMVLYNTGLFVEFGATLSISAGGTEDGCCIEPDIWYEPEEAAEAAYRICEFYGIENTADTANLLRYDYLETEYEKELLDFYESMNRKRLAEADGYTEPADLSNQDPSPIKKESLTCNPIKFSTDLDFDRRNESYLLGIRFSDAESNDIVMEETCVVKKGETITRTIHPCVWRLTNTKQPVIDPNVAQCIWIKNISVHPQDETISHIPTLTTVSSIWPGCTEVTFTVDTPGTWIYKVEVVIDNHRELSVQGSTTFVFE